MTNNYCGYVCGEAIDKQQEIVDELNLFAKEDPAFAQIMVGRLITMLKKVGEQNG